MTTTASYRFDGYGVQSNGTAPGGTLLRFAGGHGYEDDGPAGSQLLGARYYDPTLGRFLSPDPIGHAGGLNLYGYCGNDPVNKVDPSGLFDEPTGWAKGFIEGSSTAGMIIGGFLGGGGGGLIGITTGPFAVAASPAAAFEGGLLGAGAGFVTGRAIGHLHVVTINGIGWLAGKAGETIAAMSSKKSGGRGMGNAGSGRGGGGCGGMKPKQYEEAVRKATGGKREFLRDLTGKEREFDSVTKDAIHQATTTPGNLKWLEGNEQWRQTIRLAGYLGKKAHFWFSKGANKITKDTLGKAGGIVHDGLD